MKKNERWRHLGFTELKTRRLDADSFKAPSGSIRSFGRASQARWSRNEAAAIMLGDLVYELAGTGLRTPEIEEANQAAWVAISALAKTLKEEGFAAPAH
jgi:hypothetical protein